MHALHQDEHDQNASGRRAGKSARQGKRAKDRDRFLLTVTGLARLDRMSPSEFEMFCENALPGDE